MDNRLVIRVDPASYLSFDNFHKVASLACIEATWSPIVEYQQLGFGEGIEQAREASVPMCQFEFAEQPRHVFVKHGDAVPTGGLREGTGQPGFSCTVIIRLSLSLIQRPIGICWKRAYSRPRRVL